METAQQGRETDGHLAAGLGVVIGAHVGLIPGGILGTFAYLPFVKPTGGGFDALIGSFFGALAGVIAGGAAGCFLALRMRRHAAPRRTAALAAALLLAGAVVFVVVLRAAADADQVGWWYGVAFEGPILLVAAFVRRLTPGPAQTQTATQSS